MENNKAIAVFESKQIRRHYDEKTEVWYFSLVDIVEALTDSTNATCKLTAENKEILKKELSDSILIEGINDKLMLMNDLQRNEVENLIEQILKRDKK